MAGDRARAGAPGGWRVESGALELGEEVFQAVVADGGAFRHAGGDYHVPDLQARVADGRDQARFPVFFGQVGGDHRDCVGECFENFREDYAGGRVDLAVFAVKGGFALGVAVDETPLAADPEVDLAYRDGIAVAEAAPPLPDVL